MKKFKFKSLTMRIWTTFTAIILIIICSISIVYLVAYRRINEKARMEDLKVAHGIFLKNINQQQPNGFEDFKKLKNLKGAKTFTVKIDENKNVETYEGNIEKPLIEEKMGKSPVPPKAFVNEEDKKLWLWMASYINKDKISEKQVKANYNDTKYMFIISSITSNDNKKSYYISYMPNIQDNSLLYIVICIGGVFIAISFLASKLVANYISKPLKKLEEYTERIAKKDWKEPMEVRSRDEIGRLGNAMNRMQRELKHADEEEKMFLQSISHDLKTPVMVIMSHADAIMDGVYIDSVEKTAEIIRNEAICLEKKIKQMLYLNTLDYVLENNNENVQINLRELLLHIINRFEVINSKIQWNLNLQDSYILGNEDKIQVSIENILDNALRYAEEVIAVTLKKEDTQIVLEIYNDGPNIDEKHIGNIFDNLYKDKTGNFGLGLAISKKIIDFYNGEIKVVNKEKGVSFIIKFRN